MKFGARLEHDRHAPWAHHYIDYSRLKKLIKVLEDERREHSKSRGGEVEGKDTSVLLNFSNEFALKQQEAFLEVLVEEVSKCNDFFLSKERYLKEQTQTFTALLLGDSSGSGKGGNSGSGGGNASGGVGGDETPSLSQAKMKQFIRVCEEVDTLRKFVVFNYLAVMKILKKFDRWLPRSPDEAESCGAIQIEFLPRLLQEPFYRSAGLAATFTDLQVMAELLFSTSGQPISHIPESLVPTTDAFVCAICKEVLRSPVVLSCAHRFCWPCLAQVHNQHAGRSVMVLSPPASSPPSPRGGADKKEGKATPTSDQTLTESKTPSHPCPICRKEIVLAPGSYKVHSLLSRYLSRQSVRDRLRSDDSSCDGRYLSPVGVPRPSLPRPRVGSDMMRRRTSSAETGEVAPEVFQEVVSDVLEMGDEKTLHETFCDLIADEEDEMLGGASGLDLDWSDPHPDITYDFARASPLSLPPHLVEAASHQQRAQVASTLASAEVGSGTGVSDETGMGVEGNRLPGSGDAPHLKGFLGRNVKRKKDMKKKLFLEGDTLVDKPLPGQNEEGEEGYSEEKQSSSAESSRSDRAPAMPRSSTSLPSSVSTFPLTHPSSFPPHSGGTPLPPFSTFASPSSTSLPHTVLGGGITSMNGAAAFPALLPPLLRANGGGVDRQEMNGGKWKREREGEREREKGELTVQRYPDMLGRTIRGVPIPDVPPCNALDVSALQHLPLRQRGAEMAADMRPDKRQKVSNNRLLWTPELHRRFVAAVEVLGLDTATPLSILELMRAEGLKREQVNSHLQKYKIARKSVPDGCLLTSMDRQEEGAEWRQAQEVLSLAVHERSKVMEKLAAIDGIIERMCDVMKRYDAAH
uniref:SPX domain-containing protein n=1 Tax=Palpitomonas bilix TaxID=652834 RepID=A0A7S3D1F4_9EUKA|mmetsp:Transcript_18329/g.45935  ORF Transcript_18329/g.45935 Transcript_18329/m.45935 type:complete len:860 (+) Transcript_18329:285-2864(+)|eukprot:CAMPEP_0113890352 /NCGR_PEP_ID=MMETSP0780_2-20120614/14090_1 /TAXON_ID=652834 /ORGANISM="Palpitomonas bilix" /LENGTH=859 /DNA_ID=CAMNT_0000879723 /DNA_START=185 /DNA_END=2764 /DNA_ORIENTATION=+ /assembly_acc=CAM_ASM_000599